MSSGVNPNEEVLKRIEIEALNIDVLLSKKGEVSK